jgi:hypothetical protein
MQLKKFLHNNANSPDERKNRDEKTVDVNEMADDNRDDLGAVESAE